MRRWLLVAALAAVLASCDDCDENRNLDALNDADPFGCEFDVDCDSGSCNLETGRCNP